jgi:uncharacterized membrane protein YraQ (UPF0718 family)
MLISIWIITVFCVILSHKKDALKTRIALRSSLMSIVRLLPSISLMILLVSILLAAIPTEFITELFSQKGMIGFISVSLIGAIASIPGPIAFPLAGELYRAGANLANIASFITSLTMVGIVTAPMEIAVFGKRFTILRQSLCFLAAICIGLLMGMAL